MKFIILVLLILSAITIFACTRRYTVTFYGCGGELISGEEVQKVRFAKAATAPVYEKKGHTLSWNNDFSRITKKLKVYAVWTPIKIKITFNGNGGTLVSGEEYQVIEYGIPINAPVYKKEGYYFVWDTPINNFTEDVTITAIWHEVFTYTLIDGGYSVKSDSPKDEYLTIPSMFNGLPVIKIDKEAFARCGSLTSIFIPHTIESIDNSALFNCSNLNSISVDKNNQFYSSISGNLYNKDASELILYAIGKKETSLIVQDGVTKIADFAFKGCRSITEITIPDSVVSIGDSAFDYCINLANINVGENNQSYSSISGNLYNKDASELILYAIGKKGTSLIVPDGVTKIADFAFSGCRSITEITIPDSVISIGDSAFDYCINLAKINVGENNQSFTLIDGSLYNKEVTKLIKYDKYKTSLILPDTVTTISNYACYESCLTKVTIPAQVTTIGERAFAYEAFSFRSRPSFESVKFEDNSSLLSIGAAAFAGCRKLESIFLPDSVNSIGESAFEFCGKLRTVTLGKSITIIESMTFALCLELSSIIIPKSVIAIKDSAFFGCNGLKSITISDNIESIGPYAFFTITDPDLEFQGNLTVYANAESKPASWDDKWKQGDGFVFWGCVLDETKMYVVSFNKTTNEIGQVDEPCREGYIFAGCYTSPDFSGEVYSVKSAPIGILYVKWIKQK